MHTRLLAILKRKPLAPHWLVFWGSLTIILTINLAGPQYLMAGPVAALNTARTDHTATLLANGGSWWPVVTWAVLWAVPRFTIRAANIWSFAAALSESRYGHTATLLPDGKVLAAGGAIVAWTSMP